jgi:hypothetical protein
MAAFRKAALFLTKMSKLPNPNRQPEGHRPPVTKTCLKIIAPKTNQGVPIDSKGKVAKK